MFRTTAYRHPSEFPILLITFLISIAVVVLSAFLTQCLSLLVVVFILGASIFSSRAMQAQLMRKAFLVSPERSPELENVVQICEKRLQPGSLDVYVVRENVVNAYTFGLSATKNIVLYEPMLRIMGRGELAFVLGHEMGHVSLGHTWLNTFIGGLAGSPSPFGIGYIMYLVFQRWSRACEFSCDRAGLLACGSLNLAVSSLVRLAAPKIQTQAEFEQALTMIDAQDDAFVNQLAELFQSHPMIIKRINALKEYAASPEYASLQANVDKNLQA